MTDFSLTMIKSEHSSSTTHTVQADSHKSFTPPSSSLWEACLRSDLLHYWWCLQAGESVWAFPVHNSLLSRACSGCCCHGNPRIPQRLHISLTLSSALVWNLLWMPWELLLLFVCFQFAGSFIFCCFIFYILELQNGLFKNISPLFTDTWIS